MNIANKSQDWNKYEFKKFLHTLKNTAVPAPEAASTPAAIMAWDH